MMSGNSRRKHRRVAKQPTSSVVLPNDWVEGLEDCYDNGDKTRVAKILENVKKYYQVTENITSKDLLIHKIKGRYAQKYGRVIPRLFLATITQYYTKMEEKAAIDEKIAIKKALEEKLVMHHSQSDSALDDLGADENMSPPSSIKVLKHSQSEGTIDLDQMEQKAKQKIFNDTQKVAETFKLMNQLTEMQGENLRVLSDNIEEAKDHIQKGESQLTKADSSRTFGRKLKIGATIALILLATPFVPPKVLGMICLLGLAYIIQDTFVAALGKEARNGSTPPSTPTQPKKNLNHNQAPSPSMLNCVAAFFNHHIESYRMVQKMKEANKKLANGDLHDIIVEKSVVFEPNPAPVSNAGDNNINNADSSAPTEIVEMAKETIEQGKQAHKAKWHEENKQQLRAFRSNFSRAI